MQRFVDAALSLQCKATSLVVVLTLSVTAVVAGYLMQSSEKLAREQYDAQMVQVAAMLAKAAAPTLAAGDRDGLQTLAAEATNKGTLLYVIFSDANGKQLAVAERSHANILHQLHRNTEERVPVPGQPVFRDGTDAIPVFLDVTYPITARDRTRGETDTSPTRFGSTLLGYVRTGAVADNWHRTMASRLDLMVGVGVLATLVAVPLGFLLVRRIVSPLEGLAEAMNRFSRGELDVRSRIKRRDEVGRLALAFDRMADQHQQTHARIVGLNAELEKRVADRTRQLRELASRDPLTGLYNRRYFNEMLERRYSEAMRYGGVLSCLMVDLDGFKLVNDEFGHYTGDELLVLTARTISSQLRSADVAARYGGDEFIVLLPQTNTDDARVLAERIAKRFVQDVDQQLSQVRITMSLGISSLPSTKIDDSEALLRAADRALYDAKAAGKDRIVARTCVSTSS